MSDVQQAYNSWAQQYDSNENKTRDLEARSLRETLAPLTFEHCLEVGCGTGKNTVWLLEKAATVTAVDLSEEMLAKAKEKITSPNVTFVQADITNPWTFATKPYDLVGFSLVLEHIELLQPVFEKVASVLRPGGYLYISELHPFKQYNGSKARFDTEEGTNVVTCFNHHITDFT
ncbi:MAG TPA: class I SAM-dependent methyltransferase, partial [Lacibacter sp.]|nr:class I SAM-dependent methyltransferase [Lacibacter sp.]